MAIPKKLSRPADEVLSYPVKKKHQPRRLDPNWGGINWLEDQSETNTEIAEVYDMPSGPGEIFTVQRALGWYSAKREGHYARPMFEVIAHGQSSAHATLRVPCEACDDFSRSWACAEHPELPWDTEERQFVRPTAPTLMERLQRHCEEAARLIREQADPNRNRPGYHYSSIQDRWVPDTNDALADFGEIGAGFFRGQPITIAQQVEMATEWERQNHVSLAEAISRMSAGVNPFGPTRRDFLATLPDFSITIEETFDPGILEITGETVQSASSTVRIEVESND